MESDDDLSSMLAVFEPDQTVLHYRIIEAVGEGGMGEVYKASDLKLGRTVAIKVLPLILSHDERARKRLIREARAVSALNHPNIVDVYSIEETGNHHFIVMEFVDGKSLESLMRAGRPGLLRVLNAIAQIADALSAAHKAGFIHRDIKPSNIMITTSGQAKLLDFGIAKRVISAAMPFADSGSNLSIPGFIPGTPFYMSPEQTRADALDERTDIFSLGTVLYEAITQKNPFAAPTIPETMEAIQKITPEMPSSIHEEIPKELDRIVFRAIRRDKTKRYQHISEFAEDLRALIDQLLGKTPVQFHVSVEDNEIEEEPEETPSQFSQNVAQSTKESAGRYRLEGKLGSGAMGEVYKAFDPELGRHVALKFLRGEDPELAARFQQEAKAQARVDSKHIWMEFW